MVNYVKKLWQVMETYSWKYTFETIFYKFIQILYN